MNFSVDVQIINNLIEEHILLLDFGYINNLLSSLHNKDISKSDIFFNFLNGDRFTQDKEGNIFFEPSNKSVNTKKFYEKYFWIYVKKLIHFDSLLSNIVYHVNKKEKVISSGGDYPETIEISTRDMKNYISKRDDIMKKFTDFINFFEIRSYNYIEKYKEIVENEYKNFSKKGYSFNKERYIKDYNKKIKFNLNDIKSENDEFWTSYVQKNYSFRKRLNLLPKKDRSPGFNCIVDKKGNLYECPYGGHNLLVKIMIENRFFRIVDKKDYHQTLFKNGWLFISDNCIYFGKLNLKQVDVIYDVMKILYKDKFELKYDIWYNDIYELYDKYKI